MDDATKTRRQISVFVPGRSYTLADVEQATGVAVDRLRYVLDSRILPGERNGAITYRPAGERGKARKYIGLEAFGIVVTVLMLDAGLKRRTVMQCIELLTEYAPRTRDLATSMLYQAYKNQEICGLEIGDRQNVRLVADSQPSAAAGELPWRQVETGGKVSDYTPLVTIRINIAKLREQLPM